MTNQNADAPQVEVGRQPPAPPGANDQAQLHSGNKVYKSGPLFLSSKGIGWTSWKKRWFTLTENSLVFYRSDPVSFLSYNCTHDCLLLLCFRLCWLLAL
uniref:Rho GTPase-activating protein REN1-like n=1 Tax=Nicotiana sylvestris TaxID=4096 RepID=A0A1U7V862_NICSY|nr:PREDICTED: rho GTPase-activating protein REN1-like [Nicotiana sylvestris]XP_009764312.1 PREDICTED: rho GTPase-activating protein REN1-like [Nicotiana sylvestris]